MLKMLITCMFKDFKDWEIMYIYIDLMQALMSHQAIKLHTVAIDTSKLQN